MGRGTRQGTSLFHPGYRTATPCSGFEQKEIKIEIWPKTTMIRKFWGIKLMLLHSSFSDRQWQAVFQSWWRTAHDSSAGEKWAQNSSDEKEKSGQILDCSSLPTWELKKKKSPNGSNIGTPDPALEWKYRQGSWKKRRLALTTDSVWEEGGYWIFWRQKVYSHDQTRKDNTGQKFAYTTYPHWCVIKQAEHYEFQKRIKVGFSFCSSRGTERKEMKCI